MLYDRKLLRLRAKQPKPPEGFAFRLGPLIEVKLTIPSEHPDWQPMIQVLSDGDLLVILDDGTCKGLPLGVDPSFDFDIINEP
jgi:hypothetical protein